MSGRSLLNNWLFVVALVVVKTADVTSFDILLVVAAILVAVVVVLVLVLVVILPTCFLNKLIKTFK